MDHILTAVVPAKNGCNLRCAGCIIDQTKEGENILMQHDDYISFFEPLLKQKYTVCFSLQGYEPLLPDAFPLSRRLLAMSRNAGKSTQLVTNGTYLSTYAREVIGLVDVVVVSLDSHDPVSHDLTRGVPGAWKQTIEGIRSVRRLFKNNKKAQAVFAEMLGVNSILYPGKVNRLVGMPKLLQELGVTDWTISPLVNLWKGGHHDNDIARLRENLLLLTEEAGRYGVEISLSDEFEGLKDRGDLYEVMTIEKLDGGEIVTRLSPDASFRVGKDILSNKPPKVWDRVVDPLTFYSQAIDEYTGIKE